MDLAPGMAVTPNVRLVRLLGEGGMGSVWVARHQSLGTQVAVKFVSKALVEQDESALARFNREAALSAQIKSPHVVQIFDHGVTDDGMPFIVMELLEGVNLGERIESRGPLNLHDTRVVITQTAKALAKAHKLGIVHRDIKPDNIFLVEPEFDLFVKVLDFGIAKQTRLPPQSQLTTTGAMVGTPEFMSPEQVLSSKSVDRHADLWAVGVVAYYCLTGCVPFSGETLGSLCVAIAAGEFTPVTGLKPGLPPALDDWFRQALALEVEDRFSSARDLALGFADALGPLGAPSLEDQFSVAGNSAPELDWLAEDSFGADSDRPPPDSSKASARDQPTVAVTPKALAAKHSPTFSGASMAASAPRRRMSRVALWSLAATAIAAAGLAGILLTDEPAPHTDSAANGPPSETDETPASTLAAGPHAGGADPQQAGQQPDADDEAVDGAGGALLASPGAEPDSSGQLPTRPPRPKPVAATPRPRPSSTTAHPSPPPTATGHASAPLPELPPDRGF